MRYERKARHRATGKVHLLIVEEHWGDPKQDRLWAWPGGKSMNWDLAKVNYDLSQQIGDEMWEAVPIERSQ